MDNATPSNTSVANETVALARKLAASWGSWNEYEIQALAAALREAKAEAFEEAAKEADHFLDSGWDIGEFSGWLTRMASRLRSAQDAPATEKCLVMKGTYYSDAGMTTLCTACHKPVEVVGGVYMHKDKAAAQPSADDECGNCFAQAGEVCALNCPNKPSRK